MNEDENRGTVREPQNKPIVLPKGTENLSLKNKQAAKATWKTYPMDFTFYTDSPVTHVIRQVTIDTLSNSTTIRGCQPSKTQG